MTVGEARGSRTCCRKPSHEVSLVSSRVLYGTYVVVFSKITVFLMISYLYSRPSVLQI
jgi:hypothetical protein